MWDAWCGFSTFFWRMSAKLSKKWEDIHFFQIPMCDLDIVKPRYLLLPALSVKLTVYWDDKTLRDLKEIYRMNDCLPWRWEEWIPLKRRKISIAARNCITEDSNIHWRHEDMWRVCGWYVIAGNRTWTFLAAVTVFTETLNLKLHKWSINVWTF